VWEWDLGFSVKFVGGKQKGKKKESPKPEGRNER
jgi:hypothetical protein